MTKKLRTLRLSIYQHVLIKKNKCNALDFDSFYITQNRSTILIYCGQQLDKRKDEAGRNFEFYLESNAGRRFNSI